jgi:hypothetical protein
MRRLCLPVGKRQVRKWGDGMISLWHVPRPPLSLFVHWLLLYEGYAQPHAKERVLPTGQMQIVINCWKTNPAFTTATIRGAARPSVGRCWRAPIPNT